MHTNTQIYGGRLVDLLSPKPEDICIENIAQSLAKQCRFNGNTFSLYTVAQHSVLVSQLVPEQYALYGLLHDAHEAFFGDVSSPMKAAIAQLTGVDALEIISKSWDSIIYPAFGVDPPDENINFAVKAADADALVYEAQNLMWDCKYWRVRVDKKFKPLKPEKAYEVFMLRFTKLMEDKDWE